MRISMIIFLSITNAKTDDFEGYFRNYNYIMSVEKNLFCCFADMALIFRLRYFIIKKQFRARWSSG